MRNRRGLPGVSLKDLNPNTFTSFSQQYFRPRPSFGGNFSMMKQWEASSKIKCHDPIVIFQTMEETTKIIMALTAIVLVHMDMVDTVQTTQANLGTQIMVQERTA